MSIFEEEAKQIIESLETKPKNGFSKKTFCLWIFQIDFYQEMKHVEFSIGYSYYWKPHYLHLTFLFWSIEIVKIKK